MYRGEWATCVTSDWRMCACHHRIRESECSASWALKRIVTSAPTAKQQKWSRSASAIVEFGPRESVRKRKRPDTERKEGRDGAELRGRPKSLLERCLTSSPPLALTHTFNKKRHAGALAEQFLRTVSQRRNAQKSVCSHDLSDAPGPQPSAM